MLLTTVMNRANVTAAVEDVPELDSVVIQTPKVTMQTLDVPTLVGGGEEPAKLLREG